MARKDDILGIYAKEVEGIKEAGLFKGEAPFVSPQGAKVKMEDGRELFACVPTTIWDWGDSPRLIEAAKRTYDEKDMVSLLYVLSVVHRISTKAGEKDLRFPGNRRYDPVFLLF